MNLEVLKIQNLIVNKKRIGPWLYEQNTPLGSWTWTSKKSNEMHKGNGLQGFDSRLEVFYFPKYHGLSQRELQDLDDIPNVEYTTLQEMLTTKIYIFKSS